MKNTSKVGKIGENIACGYLVEKGYRILYRNYREKWDEIDVIATAMGLGLVFVEVKTLVHEGLGMTPEDNLTPFKLKKLRRACQVFVGKHPGLIDDKKGWQIDLLAIVLRAGPETREPLIRHYKNI